MLSTAGRVGAILELTWDRVDFERGEINLKVDQVGPRKGRATNPMNAGARAALQTAKAGSLTEYVIEWNGKPVKSIKTAFNSACEIAKLKKVTPHTLRHTAAVHLAVAGVPDGEDLAVSRPLKHSSYRACLCTLCAGAFAARGRDSRLYPNKTGSMNPRENRKIMAKLLK